jgi:hypothetical protein
LDRFSIEMTVDIIPFKRFLSLCSGGEPVGRSLFPCPHFAVV